MWWNHRIRNLPTDPSTNRSLLKRKQMQTTKSKSRYSSKIKSCIGCSKSFCKKENTNAPYWRQWWKQDFRSWMSNFPWRTEQPRIKYQKTVWTRLFFWNELLQSKFSSTKLVNWRNIHPIFSQIGGKYFKGDGKPKLSAFVNSQKLDTISWRRGICN